MKKRMRRTEMYMTYRQHQIVKTEAEEKGINFSEMMRKILDYYIENKK